MKNLKALSAAAILMLSGASLACAGEQAWLEDSPVAAISVAPGQQHQPATPPATELNVDERAQIKGGPVDNVGEATTSETPEESGFTFNNDVGLDETLYDELLMQLKLNEHQTMLWKGVVLGYLFKSQSWPHYDNIVGTLNSNRMELNALLEKLSEYPPEIQALNEIQSEFVIPRRFAVVTLEVFYKALTREQIDTFELYVVNLVKIKASEQSATAKGTETRVSGDYVSDAEGKENPATTAPKVANETTQSTKPAEEPKAKEPIAHPIFRGEFGAKAPLPLTGQELAQGGLLEQERLIVGLLPDELIGSAGLISIDSVQLDSVELGWSADAAIQ